MIKIVKYVVVVFFITQLSYAQNQDAYLKKCLEYISSANYEVKHNNLGNALDHLQKAYKCDIDNKLTTETQLLQKAIFKALKKQKKEVDDNLKKYISEKSAKEECEGLQKKSEKQAKRIKELNTWMEADKEVVDKRYELIDSLKDKNLVNERLINTYENRCTADSSNYKNWLRLYHVYNTGENKKISSLKKKDQMILALNKIIKLKEDFPLIYLTRGRIYAKIKNYKKAISDFDKAIALDPDYASVYVNRGAAFHNLKQYTHAIADYDKAIELNTEDLPSTYYNRGYSYYYMKNYKKALESHNKAIDLDPNYSSAYFGKGVSYHDLKQYKKAIENYNKVIELDPSNSSAYANIGVVYYNLKDYNKSIENYSKAIKLNPNYTLAYNNIANAFDNLKQYDKALENYNKAIKLDSNYASAYYGKGLVFQDLTEYEKAIKNYDKAIELDSNYVRAYNAKGIVFGHLNRYEEAIKNLDKAIKLDSTHKTSYTNRAKFRIYLGKIVEGLQDINTLWQIENKQNEKAINTLKKYANNNGIERLAKEVINKPDNLKTKALSFYSGYSLNELKSSNIGLQNSTVYFITDASNQVRFLLYGKSNPIHFMNEKIPITLNSSNIGDYLDFFCYHVHGEEGAFKIIASEKDIEWNSTLKPDVKEQLTKEINKSLKELDYTIRQEKDFWLTERIILYSNAIFKAKMKVFKSGMIEMLNDKPIMADLPVKYLSALSCFYRYSDFEEKEESTKQKEFAELDKQSKAVLAKYDILINQNKNIDYVSLFKTDDIGNLLAYYEHVLRNKDKEASLYIQSALLSNDGSSIQKFRLFNKQVIHNYYLFDELYLNNTDSKKLKQDIAIFNIGISQAQKSNILREVYYKYLIKLREYLSNNFANEEDITKILGQNYNSLAWYQILNGNFAESEKTILKGLKIDPDNLYFQSNLPIAYLFQGKYDEALEIYKRLKDQPFDAERGYPTFKDAFLDDFKTFKKQNLIPYKYTEDVEKIISLLNN